MGIKVAPSAVAKGVGLYFAAAVGGYLYLRSTKAPAPSQCGCGSGAPAHRHGLDGDSIDAAASSQETFDRIADRYDSLINVDETLMGLKLMRRWLMRHAEVSTSGLSGLSRGPAWWQRAVGPRCIKHS